MSESVRGVNEAQVGGTHYYSQYIHWDFVLDTGQGYLEGNATKYISRWRKKGGKQDLAKAVHYLDKLIEVAGRTPSKFTKGAPSKGLLERLDAETCRFGVANGLNPQELDFCQFVVWWPYFGTDLLFRARDIGLALIEQAEKPVPVSDSNRHAERA